MKLFIVLILTSLTLNNTKAQIATGGVYIGPQTGYVVAVKKVLAFENHLYKKSIECAPLGKVLKDKDLLQAYLKLSLYRSTNQAADKCEKANAYFKCMNDEQIVSMSKSLKDDNAVKLLLMSRYSITKSLTNQILDFYADLGKKIED